MRTIAIVGPLDTKGPENLYLKQKIEENGMHTIVIDIRTMGKPGFIPDIESEEVAAAAGTTLAQLLIKDDRAACVHQMGCGAAKVVCKLQEEGKISGVISMGGAQTTSMAAEIMRQLPIGFPKVMASTLATSVHDQTMLAGIGDTFVINPLVDVAGLNDVLKMVIERAAGAICGMVQMLKPEQSPVLRINPQKICIGISMWGVTTKCVMKLVRLLEEKGYQTLVFHATGIGGHIMEQLILQGVIKAVADITLAEFANPLIGGEYELNSVRLTSAARMGIPQVIVPGGCDMVKHIVRDGEVPEKYKDCKYYLHNPSLLFTRSSVEDSILLGEKIAEKANVGGRLTEVLFPLKGISAYDIAEGPLFDAAADEALEKTLERNLTADVRFERVNAHINDSAFADKVFERLTFLLERG